MGLIIVLVLAAPGFLSMFWTPFAADTSAAVLPPDMVRWLGTDATGKDMLAALMAGVITSLLIALFAVLIAAVAGVALGIIAAALGGAGDWLLMRLCAVLTTIPALILAIALAPHYGANAVNATLLLGLVLVPVMARSVRDGICAGQAHGSMAAARLAGLGHWAATMRHVVPGIGGLIVARALALFATGIAAEAALSFAGLGAQPPTASLGLMLAVAREQLLQFPHLAVMPGAVLVVLVAALNAVADALRDGLDPALRGHGGFHAVA